MSFTKLFSSITESSLWSEDHATRLLFVTMLARADASGFVEASIPGLARVANLSMEETENALEVLSSPDPHSKDLDEYPENEGRRITKAPGGWCIINYQAYRDRRGEQERREYMRDYMREYRKKRKQSVNSVSRGKPRLAQGEAEAEGEASIARSARSGILAHADAIYAAYPIKKGKKRAMAAIEKALRRGEDWEAILAAVQAFARAHKRGGPAPHAGTYFNQERWADEDNGKVSKLIPDGKPGQVSRTVPKYESNPLPANYAEIEQKRRERDKAQP